MERVRKRRGLVIASSVAALSIGLVSGVAVAMLGGLISGVNLATGLASSQAQPCQSDALNFEFVDPKWNGEAKAFNIREVSFENFSSSCVSSGASLSVVVTEGNSTFLDTVIEPDDTSGTIELSNPLNSNRAPNAEINYLVKNQ